MILGKLEEIIRNKQLIIRSSRTYEEIKTFTWNTGRAQAKRGFNDDLVMSLAIGTWLYDASSDYSKSSKNLNDAMLKAMSAKKTEYHYQNMSKNNKIIDDTIQYKQNTDNNDNSPNKSNKKVPKEFHWLFN